MNAMINWKKISLALFVAGLLGLLLSVLFSLVQMTAMYAPPDIMATQTARKGQDFTLLAVGLGIIFLSSVVTFFIGKRQEKSLPPPEEQ